MLSTNQIFDSESDVIITINWTADNTVGSIPYDREVVCSFDRDLNFTEQLSELSFN